jgi:hypothetical protein
MAEDAARELPYLPLENALRSFISISSGAYPTLCRPLDDG